MSYDSRPPSGITENWQRLVGDIDDAGSAILNQFFEFFIEQKSVAYCVTVAPTAVPTPSPTSKPTRPPTNVPSPEPTPHPTPNPTPHPTPNPTPQPTTTSIPTKPPTSSPTSLKICLRVVGPDDQFNGFYVLWPRDSFAEDKYWVDEHSEHKIYVVRDSMYTHDVSSDFTWSRLGDTHVWTLAAYGEENYDSEDRTRVMKFAV